MNVLRLIGVLIAAGLFYAFVCAVAVAAGTVYLRVTR